MASSSEDLVAPRSIAGTVAERDCPRCGARIRFDRAFVAWCDACDWNVDVGSERTPATSPLGRLRATVARRAGDSLYRQLVGSSVTKPRLTISRVAAYAISGATLAVSMLILLAGILLIVSGRSLIVQVAGVVVVVVAFVGRPRFLKAPERRLSREEAPELYGLVDEIAAALGAPRPAAIGVLAQWNAMTYRYGIRQRHALAIGLPLWAALDERARVSLLGHELAHGVNGDTTRGIVVGSALQTLAYWAVMFEPDDLTGGDRGLLGLAMIPFNVLLYGLAWVIQLVALGLVALTLRDSQRAELYADRLAASIAGTDAEIGSLEGLYGAGAFERAVSAIAIGRRRPMELYAEIARQIAQTPPSEIERLRRRERAGGTQLIATHPPIYLRLDVLRAIPPQPPRIILTPDRSARIETELAGHREAVAQEAIEEYVDAIS
jgi:Zn-dependent protease with chaperone function